MFVVFLWTSRIQTASSESCSHNDDGLPFVSSAHGRWTRHTDLARAFDGRSELSSAYECLGIVVQPTEIHASFL